ncbi:DUF693 family protein (plasmid) [Borrelia coriaceae]|uniref:Uncharacterized protein n=1 Tax=Borrelia coriaceae ATCC 43381 TaxID=1408429 RepID=W5SXT9_9SPIR|nr:DUF693 family protein [Borrelia coriaceae]AHH11518.1 Hypothetical protein BCO_0008601 [Borrelia coriaceae ATCC 43381]UPA16906.1 DUF693 family protein [Borrelia coriaceae]
MESRLIKYDFKIEFFSSNKAQPNDPTNKPNKPTVQPNKHKAQPNDPTNPNENENAKSEEKPKIVILTEDGIYIDISISDTYSSNNYVCGKKGKLTIWNLNIDFTENVNEGDIVRISYKKFWDSKDYDFIMAGYLGVPMSTDYTSGDFSVDLEIHLATKSNYFNRKLEINQFQGMTVENAIKKAFPNRNIINMSYKDRNQILTESFNANTPLEFIEKITKKYVQSVRTDIGIKGHEQLIKEAALGISHVECNYIFTNATPQEQATQYLSLEDFGLEFIPQQEITIGSTRNIRLIYWNAKIMYTHKLQVGNKVKFIDGLGKEIKTSILQTNATLSNNGKCSLFLKLYDDSNYLNIKGEAK